MSAGGTSDPAGMTGPERRAVEAVDEAYLLECLAELVAVRSLAGRETPAQEAVAARMEALGMEMDVWDLDFDALRRHPAYAVDVERDAGLGVAGAVGAGRGRTLVLNGHVDVVDAGEPGRWSRPPWEAAVADGRVWGRGTCDMKGGLCCALAAVRALREAGVELEGRLEVQSVIGEEDGGVGTLAAVLRGHTGDGAVVLEPTRLTVAPAQAGALNFRVAVPGRAAHGAFREEGVNPIDGFLLLYRSLRELEAARNRGVDDPLFSDEALPFALAIGRVEAGIWASTVPERLTFEGRLGFPPSESPEAARRALEDTVARTAAEDAWLREHPPTVEWAGARFEAARTDEGDPIVRAVSGAFAAVTGEAPRVGGMRYGADMRLLANEGATPTLLFGPGDVRDAHRPDESVAVADLVTAARVVALAAVRFCGIGSPTGA